MSQDPHPAVRRVLAGSTAVQELPQEGGIFDRCPISSIEIEQGCTHEEADAIDGDVLLIRESMGLPLFG